MILRRVDFVEDPFIQPFIHSFVRSFDHLPPPPPRVTPNENNSPRVVLRSFYGRLRQNYVITKKCIPQELFCVLSGCADLRLFHVDLREIYVTPEKIILREFFFRGLQMGGQIRRGRIWRFWGAPIFSPEVPKYQFLKGFGTSGRKIGAPQKRQIQPRRI